ncbi:MAG: DoxX family membrane protein [Deltaproteobacteria bacterium]|nr:DoxX family membrane protein [Deltaproteobacteria bacterium]MBN2672458.1 DoxX family membrane protein [Deltaproteobacteria bacterium]
MNAFIYWKGHRWLALPARLYLGGVFIWASLHKIALPETFALDVATYNIVPLYLINLMAICLPWIEIISGAMMVAGYKSRASAWMITGMMVMFLTALLIALSNGLDMSCGCFASSTMEEGDAISTATVFRDVSWLVLGIYILLLDRQPLGLESWLRHRNKRNS